MTAAHSDSLLLKQSCAFRPLDALRRVFFLPHWHKKLVEFYFVQRSVSVACKVMNFAYCSSQNPEGFLEMGDISRHFDPTCWTPLGLLQTHFTLFLNSETDENTLRA